MSNLNDYLKERDISKDQMREAHARTQAVIDACDLREARRASGLTQQQLAQTMGVSQNRVSRMENGDIGSMSLDTVRRYVEALGGHISLTADFPARRVSLA